MGLLFNQEYPLLNIKASLFGDIMKHHRAFSYNYDNYIQDFNSKKAYEPFVKVWTGR
jgi:hypothetical protein